MVHTRCFSRALVAISLRRPTSYVTDLDVQGFVENRPLSLVGKPSEMQWKLEQQRDLVISLVKNSWAAALCIEGFGLSGSLVNVVFALHLRKVGCLRLVDCILSNAWLLENMLRSFSSIDEVVLQNVGGRGALLMNDQISTVCAQRGARSFTCIPAHIKPARFTEEGVLEFLFSTTSQLRKGSSF